MSLALIAAKQSPPNSRIRSGKRGVKGGNLRSGRSSSTIASRSPTPRNAPLSVTNAIRAAEFVAEHRAEPLGHAAFEFEPDHAAAPTPLDRIGEVADEILGFFLDLEIAVAQHAELGRADHA